jgi:hypothetical protein
LRRRARLLLLPEDRRPRSPVRGQGAFSPRRGWRSGFRLVTRRRKAHAARPVRDGAARSMGYRGRAGAGDGNGTGTSRHRRPREGPRAGTSRSARPRWSRGGSRVREPRASTGGRRVGLDEAGGAVSSGGRGRGW